MADPVQAAPGMPSAGSSAHAALCEALRLLGCADLPLTPAAAAAAAARTAGKLLECADIAESHLHGLCSCMKMQGLRFEVPQLQEQHSLPSLVNMLMNMLSWPSQLQLQAAGSWQAILRLTRTQS